MSQPDDQPEFLTVRELAELLRIKERKVYDLAASGEVPCSRVTGRLLFPTREVRDWIAAASTGPGVAGAGATPAAAPAPRPQIFLGSHDPLLEWALRQSRCGLATYFDGSLDGLARFRAREGIATGLHVHDAATGGWNVPAVAGDGVRDAVLVGWALRRRGLAIRPEAAGEIRSIAELAGRRVAPRQKESGTALLFDALCREAGLAPGAVTETAEARSENDAVLAVVQGVADAAFGLESLAASYGLAFVPLVEERFDLLVDRRDWFEPPMQRLMAFCDSPEFRAKAAELAGYDISELGRVRWNG